MLSVIYLPQFSSGLFCLLYITCTSESNETKINDMFSTVELPYSYACCALHCTADKLFVSESAVTMCGMQRNSEVLQLRKCLLQVIH